MRTNRKRRVWRPSYVCMPLLCPSGPLARACLPLFCLVKQLLGHFSLPGIGERLSWNGKSPLKRSALNPSSLSLFLSLQLLLFLHIFFFFHCSLRPQTIDNSNTHCTHTDTPFVPKKQLICSNSLLTSTCINTLRIPRSLNLTLLPFFPKDPSPSNQTNSPLPLPFTFYPTHTHPSPLLNDNYLHISQ